MTTTDTTPPSPVTRRRHPLQARRLTVHEVTELSASMRRVVLRGPELTGFRALGPADHVKVCFPVARPDGGWDLTMPVVEDDRWLNRGAPGLVCRDYTVRTHEPSSGELVLDLVVHEHGPAGRWAAQAQVGQELGVLGPRGSALPPLDRRGYLLAADETGLPALTNWLDRLPEDAQVWCAIEVGGPEDEVALPTRPGVQVSWLHRGAAAPGTTTLLPDAVAGALEMVAADGRSGRLDPATAALDWWAWAGAETSAVRAIRGLLTARGLDRRSFQMTGYWRVGVADFDHHSPEA